MTPHTVWIGGHHPCDLTKGGTAPPRAPATVLKGQLLDALEAKPGSTNRDLREVFPHANPKTINSALTRQEQAGRAYSRRCLEEFDDTGERRWVLRWFLTVR